MATCRVYDAYAQANSDGSYQGVVHFTDAWLPNYWASPPTTRTAAETWVAQAVAVLNADGKTPPVGSQIIPAGSSWTAPCGTGGGGGGGGGTKFDPIAWIKANPIPAAMGGLLLVLFLKGKK